MKISNGLIILCLMLSTEGIFSISNRIDYFYKLETLEVMYSDYKSNNHTIEQFSSIQSNLDTLDEVEQKKLSCLYTFNCILSPAKVSTILKSSYSRSMGKIEENLRIIQGLFSLIFFTLIYNLINYNKIKQNSTEITLDELRNKLVNKDSILLSELPGSYIIDKNIIELINSIKESGLKLMVNQKREWTVYSSKTLNYSFLRNLGNNKYSLNLELNEQKAA